MGATRLHQRGVDLRTADQADAVDGEQQRELVRGQPVPLHQHERRADDVAHQDRGAEAGHERERDEVPVAQQRRVAAGARCAGRRRGAASAGQRLRQAPPDDDPQGDAEQPERDEHRRASPTRRRSDRRRTARTAGRCR